MQGYDSTSYGTGFADVYDEWYADVTDVDATVRRMLDLAGPTGSIVELGVGTGRIAVPMAAAGLAVTGIDSSEAMLERLRERSGHERVDVVLGDMVEDLPNGPFDVALVAYNTIFNLVGADAQAACFAAVADRLQPGGCFVVEAFVPDTETRSSSGVTVRSITVDRVVLSVSLSDQTAQMATGQFIDISESGGVRLRPWQVRWSTPAQLDEMARAAGLRCDHRWADMSGTPFDEESDHHVSVYRRDE